MATLTVGAAGVSYAAATVLGAVGLGVAGLALLRSRRRERGYGGRGGGYHHRRRRRSHEEEEDLENFLEEIREKDVSGCGKKLVCHLAATDQQLLTVGELSILSLVGPPLKPGDLLTPGATVEYKMARGLGQMNGDCGQAFPGCPLNDTQLRDAVRAYLP